MGIHGVRMINELKDPSAGTGCSFSEKINCSYQKLYGNAYDKEAVRERVETFGMYCSERLRRQNTCCKMITVFVQTNRFRKDLPEYRNAMTKFFPILPIHPY
jgi:DNA polymerase V